MILCITTKYINMKELRKASLETRKFTGGIYFMAIGIIGIIMIALMIFGSVKSFDTITMISSTLVSLALIIVGAILATKGPVPAKRPTYKRNIQK